MQQPIYDYQLNLQYVQAIDDSSGVQATSNLPVRQLFAVAALQVLSAQQSLTADTVYALIDRSVLAVLDIFISLTAGDG